MIFPHFFGFCLSVKKCGKFKLPKFLSKIAEKLQINRKNIKMREIQIILILSFSERLPYQCLNKLIKRPSSPSFEQKRDLHLLFQTRQEWWLQKLEWLSSRKPNSSCGFLHTWAFILILVWGVWQSSTLPSLKVNKYVDTHEYYFLFHHKMKVWRVTLFENYSKCRIWIFEFWHFSPIFVLLKLTCLVTLFDRKLQVFKNSPKWTIFGIFN